MKKTEKLIQHYSTQSKHSNYQILPRVLQQVIKQSSISTQSRYEKERLDYLLKSIDVVNKTILDIGGNAGYFSFELLSAGAQAVYYYEGNEEHAKFVQLAAEAVGLDHKLYIANSYFTFDGEYAQKHDVILLFNVLHHVGDDYSSDVLSISEARQSIIKQLNSLSKNTDTLVFQLGFNWMGDPNRCLFETGTKKEMIEFIKEGVVDHWSVQHIGIAQRHDEKIIYCALNSDNVTRDDSMGEFLNRPLFILKAKK